MNVTVNGETTELAENATVSDLLTVREVKMPDMVSVELNGEILEREAFDSSTLKAGDEVELMYFMGGGGC